MPLNDIQIKELCKAGMVTPFQEELVNPTSLDIRVGYDIKIEKYCSDPKFITPEYDPWISGSLEKYNVNNPFIFSPGRFILLPTLETFNLPNNITAHLLLTSSIARSGYDHALAAWCDPGWHGSKLTMEIRNNFQYHSISIFPGLVIGQMIFEYCDTPEHSYAVKGRYNGDRSVAASKGFKWLLPPASV
jgi:dCTP deaminase